MFTKFSQRYSKSHFVSRRYTKILFLSHRSSISSVSPPYRSSVTNVFSGEKKKEEKKQNGCERKKTGVLNLVRFIYRADVNSFGALACDVSPLRAKPTISPFRPSPFNSRRIALILVYFAKYHHQFGGLCLNEERERGWSARGGPGRESLNFT